MAEKELFDFSILSSENIDKVKHILGALKIEDIDKVTKLLRMVEVHDDKIVINLKP